MSKTKKIILSVTVGTVLTALSFYIALPAISIYDVGFWIYLSCVALFYGFPFLFSKKEKQNNSVRSRKGKINISIGVGFKAGKIPLIIIATPIALALIGGIISSEVFNARAYASVITVKESVFEEDIKETNEVTNIALMDSASAQEIGKRTLGPLSDVVSQYEIGERYTQINYHGTPKKVANIEYADFFKWLNNRSNGVPGYVMVDPVASDAEYVKLDKPLKYVDSAFFGEDLTRKLRFKYPTKIFDFISFEVDEEGNPYYIVSCLKPHVFPFGAMDVNEVIIFDPCTGESELYDVKDVPSWVDAVYSGDLAEQKYNWHGMLSGGYINSLIGNKGCKQTTEDYGYIVIGDDVWYYTGVTSVTSDESNIGFIITNARTGEYKYYPVVGAEEYSAMSAAEGEVQEKNYEASFPSLINVSGEATYIMVLKSQSGIVELYALVNVENYSIVATGDTQASAMRAYKKLLSQNGVVNNGSQDADDKKAMFTVESIRDTVIDGDTVIYIKGDDGYTYRFDLAENENFILIDIGWHIEVKYTEAENTPGIRKVVEYKLLVTY
ncbi:MAG: hypothetical protein E7649_05245 [Ruminococcaceae bacterium]|nr:hypothetical protein [Oscillospiraceae bacterium]